MTVAAEHRYQKLNRQQIDWRKPNYTLQLEQQIGNLTDDNKTLIGEVATLKAELEAVRQQAQAEIDAIKAEADKRCKHADINHEFMVKYMRMFKEEERGHKKASAILQCLTPTQLDNARQDAQNYFPQLWEKSE